MITPALLDSFLARVDEPALTDGRRYARDGRVGSFVGSDQSALTVVQGQTAEYDVVLWADGEALAHRCSCPSWRDPCKHEVAAAVALRGRLGSRRAPARRPARAPGRAAARLAVPTGARAREQALGERIEAARSAELRVEADAAPYLRVRSPSGFAYRVHLRGGLEGPHGCECPDFEANRLHTCKHVERARAWMRAGTLPEAHRDRAARPRVYLHFGELVEPRLVGRPEGPGAARLLEAFDERGLALRPLARDERELRDWLLGLGESVEAEALEWLERRIHRRPELPPAGIQELVGELEVEGGAGLPPPRPYPFQWQGAEFLARTGRALLADEMGLGKTVQAILAARALARASRPVRRVTVVCPASLRSGWRDEIRRWTGEEARLLEGSAEERARVIASGAAGAGAGGGLRWLITHYEQVLRDYPHHQAACPDLLVVDEAQRVKGLSTRTARVLKAIETPYLFALTGTPLENRLEEAYAIAQLVDQRLLPPLWQIDRDHFVREGEGGRVVLYRNLQSMRSRLAPAFLRRRKEDVAPELPERIVSRLAVPMHEAAMPAYQDALAQAGRLARLPALGPEERDRLQRLLTLARRCCNGPHLVGHPAEDHEIPKLKELEESLRELCVDEGRKAVVFSEWAEETQRIAALGARMGLKAFHLHGGVPVARRPALIHEFGAHAGPALFVSTDAGGLGLNLEAADVVVSLDLPWNPGRLEQRIARVHRIGTQQPVHVLLLVTRGSLEERLLKLHETKQRVLGSVFAEDGEDVIEAPGGSGVGLGELLQAPGAPEARERSVAEPRPAAHGLLSPADAALLLRVVEALPAVLGPGEQSALAALLRRLADRLDRDSPPA